MAGPTSFYAADDVEPNLDKIPSGSKSEVINKALRQYFAGADANRDARIEELEEKREKYDERAREAEEERQAVEQELASLREAKKAEENSQSTQTEEVVALFESVVSTAPKDRETRLARRAGGVPEETWRAVLDGVDIHFFDDGKVKDEDPTSIVAEAGYDAESVLGGAMGNEVTDDNARDDLAGLTERERTEVVAIAETAQ